MNRLRKWVALALACLLVTPVAVYGQGQTETIGRVQVFYGVVPAEVIGKEAKGVGHDTRRGRYIQHLVVALIDAQTGRRIQDATVLATVSPLGLAAEQKELAPMLINGSVTYGNFFHFPPSSAPFRIAFDIRRPGTDNHGSTHAEFTYTPPGGVGPSR